MKILLINYEFPPLGGGAGNATFYIAREMVRSGHDVLVLTTWFRGLKEYECVEEFKVLRVKSLRRRMDRSNPLEMMSFVFAAIKKIPEIIKNFKPEKIAAFFSIPSGVVAYWTFKKFHMPYIVILCGSDVPRFPGDPLWHDVLLRFYHRLMKFMTRRIWRNAERVVAKGHGLQKLAQKTAQKIGIDIGYVSNGVDCDKYHPDEIKRNNNAVKILFVGRLSKEKGLEYLLEGVGLIKNIFKDYNATVELIGDGPMRGELDGMVKKLEIGEFVNFSGWTFKENLPLKYQSADIFVFPSLDEGMSNALLEAIASGLAVVATNIEANSGLVIDGLNGYAISPRNSGDLAERLKKLIVDSKIRIEFGHESRKIAEDFSWKNIVLSYLKN